MLKPDMDYILALDFLYNLCCLLDTHTIFSFCTSHLVTYNHNFFLRKFINRLFGLNYVVFSDKIEACCCFHKISSKWQYISIRSQKNIVCSIK